LKKDNEGRESTVELDNPGDPIHAGQIFAEMLGAVCHPEFFNHTEIEVPPLSTGLSPIKVYNCWQLSADPHTGGSRGQPRNLENGQQLYASNCTPLIGLGFFIFLPA
jgi:hypothetical protein